MISERKFIVVIPARYDSVRLPGKPLIDICGKPMIVRVFEIANMSSALEIIIATDDERIVDVCSKYNIKAELTSGKHTCGTDRIFEIAEKKSWSDNQIVVNLQGDEPLMPANLIDQVANILIDRPEFMMSTLYTKIKDFNEWTNKDVAKVILSRDDRAMYFSRAPIPFFRDASANFKHIKKHIGLYAYTVKAIKKIASSAKAPIEEIEKLEQLRALWLGIDIVAEESLKEAPISVDAHEDLLKAREIYLSMKN